MDGEFWKFSAVNVMNAIASSLAWVFIVPLLIAGGFTPFELCVFFLVGWSSAILLILVPRSVSSRTHMSIGLLARALSFLLLAWFFSAPVAYVVAVLFAVLMVEYWVPFNSLYELRTSKGDRAFLNSLYYFPWVIAGVFLPGVGGWIAVSFGYAPLFVLGAVILFMSAVFILRFWDSKTLAFRPFKGLRAMGWANGVSLCEGVVVGAWSLAVPLVTISLVGDVFGFGLFFSYLGLVAAAASLFIGKMSDIKFDHKRYTYPVVLVTAAILLFAGVSGSWVSWVVFMGVASFFMKLADPMLFTVVADASEDLTDGMVAREISLNAGRVLGTLVVLALLGTPRLAVAVGGIAYLLSIPFVRRARLL
ncbi:MAG: hypothetical protein JW834_04555 [Candidatus Diapherotrites archaeon]|nr:hypothetical protein [Candidatus Diapherotrites archaeon]